jgi:glycerol-3-phosphate O-acyltransferase
MTKDKKKVAAPTYPLPSVIPDLRDWPIHKMSLEREAFIDKVWEFAKARVLANKKGGSLREQLAKTLYSERIRLIETPWKVDPPDEMDFWSDIKDTLIKQGRSGDGEAAESVYEDTLDRILLRYIREIMGNFQIPTYRLARKVLPVIFDLILNAANGNLLYRLFFGKRVLSDKLQIVGSIDRLRSLVTKGTIVLVPTHFSNLDSILVGWAADRIGLTAFSYGAGLNLYNTSILAYYFSRLGAYALDRRKKNNIYLETLKAFSQLSIERGVHTLFFPGGTRSRSGQLENKLKMGLLGTALDAQCAHFERGEDDKKIFIVPVVINYHVVLEAKSLIDQFLEHTGKELYLVEKKAFGGAFNLLKFLWNFFSSTSEIVVNFGQPMDLFGNFVDDNGNSTDKQGRPIQIKEYFVTEGKVKYDFQRNEEYTKRLSQILVDRYYIENIVLTSHLVAYVAFKILSLQYSNLDFYGILRLPTDDCIILRSRFFRNVELLREQLRKMEAAGKIQLSELVRNATIEELIKHGVSNVGNFHLKKAIKFDKEGDLASEDMNLLYYYHNRMEGYKLEKYLEVDIIR